MKHLVLLTIFQVITGISFGQNQPAESYDCPRLEFCSHDYSTLDKSTVQSFINNYHFYKDTGKDISENVNNAQKIVDRILCLANAGSENISVMGANCPNAVAASCDSQKYIFFSTDYLEKVMSQTDSSVLFGIFAHEVGHLIRGDAWLGGDQRHQSELNADKFAGKMLGLLGFPRYLAIATLAGVTVNSTETHPSKEQREMKIVEGWSLGFANLDSVTTGTIEYIANCKPDTIDTPFTIIYDVSKSKKRSNYLRVRFELSGKEEDFLSVRSITYYLHPYSFKENYFTIPRNQWLAMEMWGSFELRASVIREIDNIRTEYILSKYITILNSVTGKVRKNEVIRPVAPDILSDTKRVDAITLETDKD